MLFGGMCLSLAAASVQAQNQTVNIMPMGDSVTARGGSPESSYRYWLYRYLTNAGFNTMFVGSTTGTGGASDGPPANSWPQTRYEGGSSPGPDAWTTETGVSDAPGATGRLGTGPAILLLDLGANDYNDGATTLKTNLLEVQANLQSIIQTFSDANPSTIILLAVPTPWVIPDPPDPGEKRYMSELGTAVTKAARAEKKAGAHVIVVNLHGGFNPHIDKDTKDGTHPDVRGEQLIAKKFFNALRPVLKKMKKEGL
jgi:hypothetical protein